MVYNPLNGRYALLNKDNVALLKKSLTSQMPAHYLTIFGILLIFYVPDG